MLRASQIIDARGSGRFEGKTPEPRPGLPSGNIAGSVNVPFSELVSESGTMKSAGNAGVCCSPAVRILCRANGRSRRLWRAKRALSQPGAFGALKTNGNMELVGHAASHGCGERRCPYGLRILGWLRC